MFLRSILTRWSSVGSKCNILFMVMITLCILGYEWQWQNDSSRTNQKITLTLSDETIRDKTGVQAYEIIGSNNLEANADDSGSKVRAEIHPSPVQPILPEVEKELSKIKFTMSSIDSKEDLEFLLNVRKLNVFAVHEMNKIIKLSEVYREECLPWWSNPLSTLSIDKIFETKLYSDYNMTFIAHPGHFRYQVQIRQRKPPIEPSFDELQITGFFTSSPLLARQQFCLGKDASPEIVSVCQCGNYDYEESSSVSDLESETLKERIIWNSSDPELITWRLHKSFSVDDYLNYTDYNSFINVPGKNEATRGEYCQPTTKMIIMVSSAPKNFLKRKVIRNTYGQAENLHSKGVRLVFLMGKYEGSDYQEDLEKEISIYDDIILESFLDSYHNLTLSHLSMYKWIYLTCSLENLQMPTHVLKADDDFFINVDLALDLMEHNPKTEYMGCLYCGTKPVRSLAYMTKYYTPHYMYIPEMYIGYLSGVTYIFKTDIIPKVLHASRTTPIIHMDDAYMTGLIPRQLKIQPRNSPLITYARIEPDPCLLRKTVNSCAISPDDMLLQWKKFMEPIPSNCTLDYINFQLEVLDKGTKTACYFE